MKYSLLLFVLIFAVGAFALDIAIDAQRDAWFNTLTGPADGWIYLSPESEGTTGVQPDDEYDCSALIWQAWDETYYYFYAEVTDEYVTVNNTTVYENDAIEQKIDPDPNMIDESTTGVAATRMSALGVDDAEVPEAVQNIDSGEMTGGWAPTEDDWARTETDLGYNLEWRIPWDAIQQGDRAVIVGVGEVFGLAINVMDNDETQRDHVLRWASDMGDLVWNEPKRHGTVTFAENNILSLSTENAITGVDTNTVDYQPAGGGGGGSELPEPVLFFDFEETEGMTCIDQGTAKNNAEIVDDPGVLERVNEGIVTRPGETGRAIEFVEQDGFGQLCYVNVPFIDALNSPNYTISCWILYTGESTNWGYLFWADGDVWEPEVMDRHIDVWLHPFDGNTTLGVDCILNQLDEGQFRVATNPPEDGVNIGDQDWHQITCVLTDNIAYEIYIDGELVVEGEGTDEIVENGGDDLWLGARPNNADATTSVKLVGMMDRVRFWDQALTTDQIEYLYLMEGPNGGSVDVAEKVETPAEFALAANYPNPFNPSTTITFSLDKTQDVSVDVYDLLGHKVKTLVSGVQTAGVHTAQWDATNDFGQRVSSGVYLYRLNAGDRVETRKMMLLK